MGAYISGSCQGNNTGRATNQRTAPNTGAFMDKDNSGGGGNSGSISIGFDIWIYTLLVSSDKKSILTSLIFGLVAYCVDSSVAKQDTLPQLVPTQTSWPAQDVTCNSRVFCS
jgi:hypothetical protein